MEGVAAGHGVNGMGLIAYFDCPTGIAGDMYLGALVDAGVPLEYLKSQLARLGLDKEFTLREEAVQKQGQAGTKVHVELSSPHAHYAHRHLPDIQQLIQNAQFPAQVQEWSLNIFQQMALAEGAVHGISPDKVHFHEVGATDAIVDIVGTCLGLDYLGVEACYWSALPTGSGTVWAAHGQLPVPVPAVLKLCEAGQVPLFDNGLSGELVTPTGAAIAVTLAKQFGARPAMSLKTVGLGAGTNDFTIPNLLRVWLGEALTPTSTTEELWGQQETILTLQTQLDDLHPQAIGYLFDKLYEQGAIEVFTQAIGMKKSRPGILLTVLCHPEQQASCQHCLFQETTTLGIRVQPQSRYALEREWQAVSLPAGEVRIKLGLVTEAQESRVVNAHPEFEDCVALAEKSQQPWQSIHQQAIAAWVAQNPDPDESTE